MKPDQEFQASLQDLRKTVNSCKGLLKEILVKFQGRGQEALKNEEVHPMKQDVQEEKNEDLIDDTSNDSQENVLLVPHTQENQNYTPMLEVVINEESPSKEDEELTPSMFEIKDFQRKAVQFEDAINGSLDSCQGVLKVRRKDEVDNKNDHYCLTACLGDDTTSSFLSCEKVEETNINVEAEDAKNEEDTYKSKTNLIDINNLRPVTSSVMNLLSINSQTDMIPKLVQIWKLAAKQELELYKVSKDEQYGNEANDLENPYMLSSSTPRLWPFVMHDFTSVRQSTIQTLKQFFETEHKSSLESIGDRFWLAPSIMTIKKGNPMNYIATHNIDSRMVIRVAGAINYEDLVEQVKLFPKFPADRTIAAKLVDKEPANFIGYESMLGSWYNVVMEKINFINWKWFYKKFMKRKEMAHPGNWNMEWKIAWLLTKDDTNKSTSYIK